jgi:hypothetical protein
MGYVTVDEIRMSDSPAPSNAPPPPAVLDLDTVVAALRVRDAALAGRLAAAIEEARTIETQIPAPTLALGIADGSGQDERIHIRGSHKNLGEVVPRRFLEVLGGSNTSLPVPAEGSGRLGLARRVVDPRSNPLLARVLVNRLWQHHFGVGIVRSTDDFGAMGQKPSHPELLDWLATEFIARGWSIKAISRLILTSSAYRMASGSQGDGDRIDPSNSLLHRMNVRRLEAEAIRDQLLAVSGQLNETMFGTSVPPYLTGYMEGRGRPARSGPVDGGGRRSIYLNVRRNFLNPMLLAFDLPVPFSTIGQRNVSNVPAQALTLMNDPLVVLEAGVWARRALTIASQSETERINDLFLTALARPPTASETRRCLTFLHAAPGDAAELAAWTDLCHVLINMKEFIFLD